MKNYNLNELMTNSETMEIKNVENQMKDINLLFDVSDEEIQESIKLGEIEEKSSSKKAGRKRKDINIKADNIVDAFLADKSDDNWKALQEFYWYGIKQFAFKFVNNYDDAYDLTIETFINAYEKIDSYDPNKSKFSTWLWTICRNNCLGFNKRKTRLNIVDNDLADIYDSVMVNNSYNQNLSEFENGTFNGALFESSTIDDVAKNLYDVSIAEMKNIDGITGKILYMKLIENKKIREIADILSMNESTVKNYLYRGKENLKRILTINHTDLVDTYYDMNSANDMA